MIHVAILTISDSVVGGTREDKSGPALAARAEEFGWHPTTKLVLPDVAHGISAALSELAHASTTDVAILTGGTGVAARDVTPEAIRAVADREIPGFGEVMRHEGRKSTKLAPLSRGGGFTLGQMLILALPGSPHGAVDSLNAVADLVPHVVDLLQGRTQHAEKPSS
jgi:molybdenum cofactor synthesis domain-containing protein